MSKITILTPEQLADRDRRAKQSLPLRPATPEPGKQPIRSVAKHTPSPMKPPAGFMERAYPNIVLFANELGTIEIGKSDDEPGFIRAYDGNGLIWHGEESYTGLDAAFDDLEYGLEAWLDEEIPGDAS